MKTIDELKRAKFKAVLFGDGAKGMAFQVYRCEDEPRLTVIWRRANGTDKGKKSIMIDGEEVVDLEKALQLLRSPKE